MPFQCSAFSALNAALGVALDTPAVAEEILTIQNGHLFPNVPTWLLGAATMGVSVTRSALKSPKLNQITPQYIRPFNAALLPPNNPNVAWWFQNPFAFNAQEEIANVITNNLATGTERETTVVLLADRPTVDPVPAGDFYTSRFTSAVAATANAWSTIAMTFEQQIPVGTYEVWQAEVTSANGLAFRMVFDNQYFRPGFLMTAALGSRMPDQYYQGVLGPWGRFKTFSLPRWQVLCNAADASFEGYMRYIKVGP